LVKKEKVLSILQQNESLRTGIHPKRLKTATLWGGGTLSNNREGGKNTKKKHHSLEEGKYKKGGKKRINKVYDAAASPQIHRLTGESKKPRDIGNK